jgi:hypothetical protein
VLVPALVGEPKQIRFLGGDVASVQLEDGFCPVALVLRLVVLGGGTELSGL